MEMAGLRKLYSLIFLSITSRFCSGKGGPLDAPIEETSEIHLKYNQNILSFRYAAMDYMRLNLPGITV